VILGTYLKQKRGAQLSVLQNDNILDPLPRYRIVEHTLKALAENVYDYSEIRLSVEHALLDEMSTLRAFTK
jgi:hypothetical protein